MWYIIQSAQFCFNADCILPQASADTVLCLTPAPPHLDLCGCLLAIPMVVLFFQRARCKLCSVCILLQIGWVDQTCVYYRIGWLCSFYWPLKLETTDTCIPDSMCMSSSSAEEKQLRVFTNRDNPTGDFKVLLSLWYTQLFQSPGRRNAFPNISPWSAAWLVGPCPTVSP